MKGIRKVLGLVGVATAVSMGTLSAQDTDRRELERRLRELREEVRALERELGERNLIGMAEMPRVLALSMNRAQLGVYVQSKANEETDEIGAVLSGVEPGGPADEAGLQEGDIITSFDGEPLVGRYPAARRDESEPAKKLIDLVGDLDPGDEVAIEYRRGDETFTTTATVEERGMNFAFGRTAPGRSLIVEPEISGARPRVEVRSFGPDGNVFTVFRGGLWSDIELVTLNEDLGRYFGTPEGLLIIQAPEGEDIDLQAGDVILSIGGREPRTPSRALRILQSYESGETADIEIMRDRSRMTVSVTIPEQDTWDWGRNRYGTIRRRF